jgi:16S rRNA (guanine527-N7)-methyltransferase
MNLDVSRETHEKLKEFVAILSKWNRRINLIGRDTIEDVWNRHIVDSVQVFDSTKITTDNWLDIGSGGGLPGLVVAIMGERRNLKVTMIESDKRKATFLRQASRALELDTQVVSDRIESVPSMKVPVISARAVADLETLLGYFERHASKTAEGIFPKGKTWKSEVQVARRKWQFSCEAIKSRTDSHARILKITGVTRV